MTQYESLSLVLGVVTLAILWLQLFLIYRTYKADHERRKKQSTIEYLNEIRKLYRPIEYKLDKIFGDKVINIDEMSDEDKINVREFLSIVEHLATGINVEVFDFELVNKMSGSYFVTMYDKFVPYIKNIRRIMHNDSLYCEFSKFCNDIEKIRGKKESPGKMEWS